MGWGSGLSGHSWMRGLGSWGSEFGVKSACCGLEDLRRVRSQALHEALTVDLLVVCTEWGYLQYSLYNPLQYFLNVSVASSSTPY